MSNVLIMSFRSSRMLLPAKIALVAFTGLFGVSFVSSSVMASLNATAFNTSPQAINSGTVSLTLAPDATSGGFTTAIIDMLPGDVQFRYVNYTQGGTTNASSPTLTISDSGSLLTLDSQRGLKALLTRCSVPWTYVAGTSTPSCSGVSTVILASTPLSALMAGTVALTSDFLVSPSAVNYLQFAISLPAGINETVANGGVPVVAGSPLAITGITAAGGVVTYAVASTTGLVAGQQIVISTATVPGFNGTKTILNVTGSNFTVTDIATGSTSTATGTLGSIQNLTAAITWTVSEQQRSATSTNA